MDDFGEQNRKITIFNWRTRKMKERIVWLMIMAMCLSGYALTANAQDGITVGSEWTRAQGGSPSDTVAFSWTPGINSCLVVVCQGEYQISDPEFVTGITFAGEALTQAAPSGNPGGDTYADIWYLNGPASTSGDIVVTYVGNVQEGRAVVGALILHGVDPTNPLVDAGSYAVNGSLVTVNVDAVKDGMLVDSFAQNDNETSATPVNAETVVVYLQDGLDGGAASAMGYRAITADGATDEGWNIGSPNERGALAVASFAPLVDPTYNPGPDVDAGPDQSVYPEDLPVQLAGTVSDVGSSDGTSAGWPEGVQSVSWHQESSSTGGTATFTAASPPSGDPIADILNSTVDFDIPGIYELVLTATDIEPKDANDVVVITLRDHADDLLIGHWEMEDNLLDTSTNSNDGTHYAYQQALPPATFADGAIGRALVLDNPNRTDPNVAYVYLGDAPELDIQTVGPEFTVTAWFKTTNGSDQVIIGKGGDTGGGIRWLLMVDSGRVRFLTDDDKARIRPRGSRYSDDGVWHFAVGVSDGYNQELRVYVDGVLTDSDDLPAGYDISGSSQRPGLIGAGTDDSHTEPTEVNDKIFDGFIDDVRVYNYALPLDDPTYLDILDLAVMGELLVMVDAGPDDARQLQPGESITLAGVVTDNGMGTGTPTNFKWETVSYPAEPVIADANAIFDDDTSPTTSVQFPLFGVYVLRLSADDENLGTTVSDEVTIEVISPDCTDVIAAGLLLAGDISGPGGTPDCRVDLYDIAEFAANFGMCNDPQAAECEDAWGGG